MSQYWVVRRSLRTECRNSLDSSSPYLVSLSSKDNSNNNSNASMKFLENEKLTELTAQLSRATLGHSHRVIDGRIEAYTMKRAGNDKKFAHTLGQKYIRDLEEQQQLLADLTHHLSDKKKKKTKTTTASSSSKRKRRSNSTTSVMDALSVPKKPRARSRSVDSPSSTTATTLGDFSELATRRLMTDLILTLNASFPDYDFSNTKPQQFVKLSIGAVRRSIYERLSELATFRRMNKNAANAVLPDHQDHDHQQHQHHHHHNDDDWLMELWMAVNDVIDLKECDVYSFEDDDETLLEEDYSLHHHHHHAHSDTTTTSATATLWRFHYFFVNKSLRRIVFFTCSEKIDEPMIREDLEDETIVMLPSEQQMMDTTDQVGGSDSGNDPGDVLAGGGMSVPISTVY
eukprot:scaffold1469_cov119-Cylindrotheca_fusiformis.AAC.2